MPLGEALSLANQTNCLNAATSNSSLNSSWPQIDLHMQKDSVDIQQKRAIWHSMFFKCKQLVGLLDQTRLVQCCDVRKLWSRVSRKLAV